jgi:hypothetical protein
MVRRLAFGVFSPLLGWLMDRYGPAAGLTLCGLFGLVGLGVLALTMRGAPQPVARLVAPEVPPGDA